MGNGNTIPISHTGNVNFNASNHQFQLQRVLCSPAITTNLIFVSKFCQDNNSSMEFFPFSYLVKDLTTGAPLAQGWSKNWLYEWPSGMLWSATMQRRCSLPPVASTIRPP